MPYERSLTVVLRLWSFYCLLISIVSGDLCLSNTSTFPVVFLKDAGMDAHKKVYTHTQIQNSTSACSLHTWISHIQLRPTKRCGVSATLPSNRLSWLNRRCSQSPHKPCKSFSWIWTTLSLDSRPRTHSFDFSQSTRVSLQRCGSPIDILLIGTTALRSNFPVCLNIHANRPSVEMSPQTSSQFEPARAPQIIIYDVHKATTSAVLHSSYANMNRNCAVRNLAHHSHISTQHLQSRPSTIAPDFFWYDGWGSQSMVSLREAYYRFCCSTPSGLKVILIG